MTGDRFDSWLTRHAAEGEEVDGLLALCLPDEPTDLINAVRIVEGFYGRCLFLTTEADAFLDEAQAQELDTIIRSCSEKLPSYEKEIRVNAAVSPVRQLRDAWKSRAEAIRTRVGIAQSLLEYHRDVFLNTTAGRARG